MTYACWFAALVALLFVLFAGLLALSMMFPPLMLD